MNVLPTSRFAGILQFVVFATLLSAVLACDRGSGADSATDSESTETEEVAVDMGGADEIDIVIDEDTEDEDQADDLEDDLEDGATEAATPEQEPAPEAEITDDAAASADETPNAEVVLGSAELFAGIPGEGPLTIEQVEVWLDNPVNHEVLPVNLPLGLAAAAAAVKGVEENPMTRAKIELGRQLYFDTRLSSDNTISCASCHHPDQGFARETQFGEGVGGQLGGRNSPVSFNRIVSDVQFWDGRAASLEEQAKGPIENPIEMGNTHEDAVKTIQGMEGYVMQFDKIFPGEGVTIDTIAKAIATFERAIVTGPAPYDYLDFVATLEKQLDEEELADLEEEDPELFEQYAMAKQQVAGLPASVERGRELFFSEKANCTACHAGANFADEQYHNLGVGMDVEEPDLGRFEITADEKDKGAFKTPTVRNVSMTAPYMHDGSQETLMEVVEWYDKGGHANPYLSDKIKKLALTEQEKGDLVAFMELGLRGSFPPMQMERLPQSSSPDAEDLSRR